MLRRITTTDNFQKGHVKLTRSKFQYYDEEGNLEEHPTVSYLLWSGPVTVGKRPIELTLTNYRDLIDLMKEAANAPE